MPLPSISTYARLGWPSEIGVIFFTIGLIFSLVPYFSDTDFGIFRVPKLSPRAMGLSKLVGPIILVAALLGFSPLWLSPVADNSGNSAKLTSEEGFEASEYGILIIVPHKIPEGEEAEIFRSFEEEAKAAGFAIDVKHDPSLVLSDSYKATVEYTPGHRQAAEKIFGLLGKAYKDRDISGRTISLAELPFGSLTLAEGPMKQGQPRGRPVYIRVLFGEASSRARK
jgi:hypothetical protein